MTPIGTPSSTTEDFGPNPQPVSGTVTSNQGTPNTDSNAWPTTPVRSDGRAYPIGTHVAEASTNVTIVPAPTSPQRLLVSKISIVNTAAASNTNVSGTVNGVTLIIAVSSSSVDSLWPGGLLMDIATGLTISIGSGGGAGIVTYDIVT